ncbi:hypothetical protein SeLEV6574_g05953 [Synchytrium endobioticum]|uniref:Uncharacterized protein n=1 Tax=Synchytrium endobioticum TaxID=286115 RepID=A0A507CRD3_9FUNG|nr:hypothetical protein SeLEV6574_g05953 [Synchytrium endobioticum]
MTLTHFIITLLLWHHAVPTIAEITDEEYRSYAESLREYRYGMTDDMKEQLKYNLEHPYGVGITDLLIEAVIPEDLRKYMKVNVRDPHIHVSLAHCEFVWEGLRTLCDLASLLVDDQVQVELEGLHALTIEYEKLLKTQVRLALGGSNDVFSPPKIYNMCELKAKVTRVKEVLESNTPPIVSSFTQAEVIDVSHNSWCIGSAIDHYLLILDVKDERNEPKTDFEVNKALICSQLVVKRMQLMKLLLSAFLQQRSQLPQTDWSKHEIEKAEATVGRLQSTMKDYQKRARRYKTSSTSFVQRLSQDTRRIMFQPEAGQASLHRDASHRVGHDNRCRCIIM